MSILQRKGRTASLDARIKADRGMEELRNYTNKLLSEKVFKHHFKYQEVDTRKRLEQRVKIQNTPRSLTTLPSRAIFIERLAQVRDGGGRDISNRCG